MKPSMPASPANTIFRVRGRRQKWMTATPQNMDQTMLLLPPPEKQRDGHESKPRKGFGDAEKPAPAGEGAFPRVGFLFEQLDIAADSTEVGVNIGLQARRHQQ